MPFIVGRVYRACDITNHKNDMSTLKGPDAYERPQMEEFSLFIEGNIALSATQDTLESIDNDTTEHGWGGNS